jgi:hypothetical protein
MPGQQRLRRDNRAQFDQHFASPSFRLRGQAATLIVGEPQSLATQLFPKNPILFSKVVDEQRLAIVHPTGHCDEHETKWIQQPRHGGSNIIVPRRSGSLRISRRFKRIEFLDITRGNPCQRRS